MELSEKSTRTDGRFENAYKKLKLRHLKELNAFETKIASNCIELCIQRNKEADVLRKQFVNAKNVINSKYMPKYKRLRSLSPLA